VPYRKISHALGAEPYGFPASDGITYKPSLPD
jgi:hypothetical protein